VTQFYDRLIFPSKSSHPEYEALVPNDLQGKKFGDFGCGQSLFIDVFRRYDYDAIFLDVSQNVIDGINYGQAICASLTDIPLDDNCLDHIFCIGVVHHIPEMEKAIEEIIRVLKPDGVLTLGVYAPKTTQALLRKWYDRSPTIGKRVVTKLSRVLIWCKNRKNGLSKEDCDKRVDDLLNTPLVRYIPTDAYGRIIGRCNAEIRHVGRISQMNVLTVTKQQS